MTIRSIRLVQHSARFLIALGLALALVYLAAGRTDLMPISLTSLLAGLLNLAILPRLRCPVCGEHFIGERNKLWFTPCCLYCGRRSGDHG
ncbi:MAG TPA: hypothetical protein VFW42_03795 [Fluviicoccus sp.]|nr:hypothetical protein [Fluviicoccus sp.]